MMKYLSFIVVAISGHDLRDHHPEATGQGKQQLFSGLCNPNNETGQIFKTYKMMGKMFDDA